MNPGSHDVSLAITWASFYMSRGLNVLPSRADEKRPNLPTYRAYWETPLPEAEFRRHATACLQIVCGRRWRLLVIDLDGPEARERWATMGHTPPTWITHSGGGGHHVWFRLPADYPAPLPKAFLWRGGEHSAIERLCDRSLVMAPPSIHPQTGRRYRFLDAAHSPKRLPLPADCPRWVLALEPLVTRPVLAPPPAPRMVRPAKRLRPGAGHYHRAEVLDAVPDKIGLARSWGVRFTGRARAGWAECHALDRPDDHPSAAVHVESGTYVDLGSGCRLSLFDLALSLGVYGDFREAVADLGMRYVHRTAVG